MISIWDMVVGFGYPEDSRNAYIGVGIGVFAVAALIALLTLPLLIYLIDKYYTEKLRKGRGAANDKDCNYKNDTFRIIISFLICACIHTLLILVMSTHGMYFLYKINKYKGSLREMDYSFTKNRLAYVVPSNHYVLYFLEAAYEAVEESLVLWGFLFLVNSICSLNIKHFYFKTFTIVLFIRVAFVFACHFNSWEFLVNQVYSANDQSNIREVAFSMYPFHTVQKSLRILEILCSLVVFIPFARYMRLSIAQKEEECNLRQEGNVSEENTPLHGHNIGLINKEKREIEFAKKYLRGYTVFLGIHFLLNFLECHFISLAVYHITQEGNLAVLIVEMVTSVLTDILAFVPSFIFLLFITYFVYAVTKGNVAQQYGEPEQQQGYRCKRCMLIGSIILFSSMFCSGLIGYLRFTNGDSILIELNNYDYILFNESSNTSLSGFVGSCDHIEFSNSPQNHLTKGDLLTLYFDPETGNLSGVNFYEDYDETPIHINEKINVNWPLANTRTWFPANTCLHNIEVFGRKSINYTLTPSQYPCYENKGTGSVNGGLRILCSNYEEKRKQETYLYCTTDTTNKCCIPSNSMITPIIDLPNHSFTASRPRYVGKKALNITHPIASPKKFLIEFYHPQESVDPGVTQTRMFFMTCLNSYSWAAVILIATFFIMGMYLSLCIVCLSRLLSSCFV